MFAKVGILVQLAGVLLLAGFLGVLRRYASRGGYFDVWTFGWVAYTASISTVATRLFVLPHPTAPLAASPAVVPPWVSAGALDLLYQIGKLVFFAALVVGARRAAGHDARRALPVGAAVAYGFVTTISAADLNAAVAWQAPVAVAACLVSARYLLAAPPARRGLGTRITGAACLVMALLWSVYAVIFSRADAPNMAPVFMTVSSYNSFIDLVAAVFLGFGMVVLVMEDAHREIAVAHGELAAAHERLRDRAERDAATGVFNRRALLDAAAGGARAPQVGERGSIVVIDVDGLKRVNDVHGHAAGDALIAHAAATLARAVGTRASVYRWGGDEFVVVMPGVDVRVAREQVMSALEAHASMRFGAAVLRLAASVGGAEYTRGAVLEAFEEADAAMYAAKARARGSGARAAPPAVGVAS